MADEPTARLQQCLERLQAGDENARSELLAGVCERLGRLTRAMLGDYRRLLRWEQTDDVLQGALLRLHRALETVRPGTLREFYRLAAVQVRRELIDLARHHFGPEGAAAHHESITETPDAQTGPLPSGTRRVGSSRSISMSHTPPRVGSVLVPTSWSPPGENATLLSIAVVGSVPSVFPL